MSKYEWERGVIKIPAKDWSAFRKALISAWNEHQVSFLKEAKEAYRKLRKDELVPERFRWIIIDSATGKRTAPTAKKMRKIPLGSKRCTICLEDADIELNGEAKTVTWYVHEGNHAREYARQEPIGKLLFQLLNKITWTRGSGGVIVGNDEYNRDSWEEGSGRNYQIQSFGRKA